MAEIILLSNYTFIFIFECMQSTLKNFCGEEGCKNLYFLNIPKKNVWASENMIWARTIWNRASGLEIVF